VATAAAVCSPAMPQTMPLDPSARRLLGRPLSVVTIASQGYGATSLPSSTILTSSDGVQSQPEFVMPVVAPLWPLLHAGDVYLLPPKRSTYRPAGYVSESPESISFLSEGGLSEEDRLLSNELSELDENCNAYELSELHEPPKRVSFRYIAFDSSYLEEVAARAESENWLDELLGPRHSPMEFPIESPSVGDPFLEPLQTLGTLPDRPWDKPHSSAAASLSHAPSSPELSPVHLPTMQLEVDVSAVATSIDEGTEGRVAPWSSSAISLASSVTSSASSTQSVAYHSIDVETVTDVSAVQSYAKGQMLPVIQSEPESDVSASYSADVATDTVGLLSVEPQPQRETLEVGIQCYPGWKDVGQQFRGEVISRQAWMGLTLRSCYSALQVSLERMAEAQAMIGSFEPHMDVNDLAERVVNETGILDLLQHCMCHFCGVVCIPSSPFGC